jgi:hypothetical protein
MDATSHVSWTSALGISSIGFMAIAVVYILIGLGGLAMVGSYGSGNFSGAYYFNRQIDEAIFQKPIAEINRDMPEYGKYITRLMMVFCSFMVGMGLLQFGVARFALINGDAWAYWVSVASNVLMLVVYWFVIIMPVLKEYHVTYFPMWHPYAFIPTVILPIAIISGAIGLWNK